MATGTLYTYPGSFRASKVLIAAQYSGAKLNVLSEPPAFKFGETNKSEDFLKKFPLGKVPAFEAADGTCIFESNAIARFVGGEKIHGSNAKEAALIEQWISFADSEITPAAATWVFPCLGLVQFNKQNNERAKEDLTKVMAILNNYLKSRTYLVGERISQADIAVACSLLLPYEHVFDASFRKPYQNTNRWFTTLVNQPEFKAVIGDFTLCTKMKQFDSKKYNELHPQEKKGKPAEQKKGKEPKKAEKKKEPKPEDDNDEPPKPKEEKDPLAKLPTGKFNLEAYKKIISNDPITTSIPAFFEQFDKEFYSIWYCEYQYNDDLSYDAMARNLVNGMFQRLDKFTKHAYASMIIFENEGPNGKMLYSIRGVWVMKGQELGFTLSENWGVDYESYSWKKLDVDADKKLISEFLSHEGEFNGDKYCSGLEFK